MIRIAVALLALACGVEAQAGDLYRWVDRSGQVHYADQPPPPGSGKVTRMGTPAAPGGADEAAAVRPAVVLYSASCGEPCDQAAGYLRQRGVPFTLKNVDQNADYAGELFKRTGAYEVPVLYVGETVQRGYSPPVWDKMLEMAGYAAKPAPEPGAEAGKGNAP